MHILNENKLKKNGNEGEMEQLLIFLILYVVFFLSLSCVLNVASVSGLPIVDFAFGFL